MGSMGFIAYRDLFAATADMEWVFVLPSSPYPILESFPLDRLRSALRSGASYGLFRCHGRHVHLARSSNRRSVQLLRFMVAVTAGGEDSR
jgi:hypothetical protein